MADSQNGSIVRGEDCILASSAGPVAKHVDQCYLSLEQIQVMQDQFERTRNANKSLNNDVLDIQSYWEPNT